jgi:hypothetical protein
VPGKLLQDSDPVVNISMLHSRVQMDRFSAQLAMVRGLHYRYRYDQRYESHGK